MTSAKLPYVQRLQRNGKTLKYFRRPGTPRITLPDAPEFSKEFIDAHKIAMLMPVGAKDTWSHDPEFTRYLRTSIAKAKERSVRDGVDFSLTKEALCKKMDDQDGRCALSGMRFNFRKSTRSKKRPFAPSIDRIETLKGYTPDNTRLITQIANYARHSFSDEELVLFCKGVANKSGKNEA